MTFLIVAAMRGRVRSSLCVSECVCSFACLRVCVVVRACECTSVIVLV